MDLQDAQRFIVIGAGKAGGGMLAGLADVLGAHSTESGLRTTGGKELIGWVNIPEGSIPSSLAHATGFRFLAARDDSAELDQTIGRDCGVTLCEARPRGVNEPTALAVRGTAEILRMVEQATPRDVVLCLLSGGSSALLCAPVSWLSLETKVAITRALSSRGAGINELNAVRRCLSNVKGGGLARRCRAGRLITLVISDVMGDPLEIIGSGPTVIEPKPDRTLAADILERFVPGEFNTVVSRLREAS